MDEFKKASVNKATCFDFNAPHVVKLKNRSSIAKMLSRFSRRKLKQKIKDEPN